jgi:N-acetylglutamate synthase-like GNAT family acetyltransferase
VENVINSYFYNYAIVTITRAKKDQLNIAHKLNNDLFSRQIERSQGNNVEFSLEDYQKLWTPDACLLLANFQGEIVGNAYSFARENDWHLWVIGVETRFQSSYHIGSNLLERTEEVAKENGFLALTTKVFIYSGESYNWLKDRGFEYQSTIRKNQGWQGHTGWVHKKTL